MKCERAAAAAVVLAVAVVLPAAFAYIARSRYSDSGWTDLAEGMKIAARIDTFRYRRRPRLGLPGVWERKRLRPARTGNALEHAFGWQGERRLRVQPPPEVVGGATPPPIMLVFRRTNEGEPAGNAFKVPSLPHLLV